MSSRYWRTEVAQGDLYSPNLMRGAAEVWFRNASVLLQVEDLLSLLNNGMISGISVGRDTRYTIAPSSRMEVSPT